MKKVILSISCIFFLFIGSVLLYQYIYEHNCGICVVSDVDVLQSESLTVSELDPVSTSIDITGLVDIALRDDTNVSPQDDRGVGLVDIIEGPEQETETEIISEVCEFEQVVQKELETEPTQIAEVLEEPKVLKKPEVLQESKVVAPEVQKTKTAIVTQESVAPRVLVQEIIEIAENKVEQEVKKNALELSDIKKYSGPEKKAEEIIVANNISTPEQGVQEVVQVAHQIDTPQVFDRGQAGCEKASIVFLRTLYNHALVEDYQKRRWIVNAAFHNSTAFEAVNNCGDSVPLSCWLFGNFRIMDIFLLSKLSFEDKLYMVDRELPPTQSRLARNSKVDQYLAYLAPFRVEIEADKRERGIDFGAMFRFGIGCEDRVMCSLGFNIPIKRCTHIMDLDLVGSDLSQFGFSKEDINFVLEDFHKSFIDVMDFFRRAILDPKNLCFHERQHKIGVGDASLFALFDLNKLIDTFDGFQVGVDLVLPSSNTYTGKEVWEIILGNGGAFQLGFSLDALYKSERNYFNPSFGVSGRVSFEYTSCRRVPKLKINDSAARILAKNVDDLIVPVFDSHYVKKFAEYDSCVHYFADQAVKTKTKMGGMAIFSLGNYFYNVFRENFRLALFYDLFYKGRDNIYVCDKAGIYNTCVLEEYTDMMAHQFSWHLAYVSKAGVEVNVGTKHIPRGKNHPKTNALFASLIANF